MPELKGGCLCGAVRYTTTAEPVMSGVCHCRDCQRFTGSAFGILVGVPKEALTIDGTMKTFTSLGGSGKPILRHFCPECGSSIAEEPGTRPGLVILNVGTPRRPQIGDAGARNILRRRVALGASDRRHGTLCQTAGLRDCQTG
jgi:hypothetical protein